MQRVVEILHRQEALPVVPAGVSRDEVPFETVAEVVEGRGYATINRTDRRRVVSITATITRMSTMRPGTRNTATR